jgi:cytochrome c
MKRIVIAAAATAALALAAGPTLAQEDVAKKNGCIGCHQVSSDKSQPPASFKVIAAKYKGKDDAAAKLEEKLSKGHHGKKPSADDAKAIVDWILGMA